MGTRRLIAGTVALAAMVMLPAASASAHEPPMVRHMGLPTIQNCATWASVGNMEFGRLERGAGRRGACVKTIQIFLNDARRFAGLFGVEVTNWPHLREDGVYGRKTVRAAGRWRRAAGIHGPGMTLYEQTLRKMSGDCNMLRYHIGPRSNQLRAC